MVVRSKAMTIYQIIKFNSLNGRETIMGEYLTKEKATEDLKQLEQTNTKSHIIYFISEV